MILYEVGFVVILMDENQNFLTILRGGLQFVTKKINFRR
jgi:hypothetical protein